MSIDKILYPTRGFGIAKGFEDKDINLPIQSTKTSAGYDFESAETVTIQPIWKKFYGLLVDNKKSLIKMDAGEIKASFKPTLVPTGVKAYMQEDEFLGMYNRSSNPMKLFLILTNGVGIVDSDYYENPDNDGAIMFQFINFGFFDITIEKGQKIGQGIFSKYLSADKGTARIAGEERKSGHGSTGV